MNFTHACFGWDFDRSARESNIPFLLKFVLKTSRVLYRCGLWESFHTTRVVTFVWSKRSSVIDNEKVFTPRPFMINEGLVNCELVP